MRAGIAALALAAGIAAADAAAAGDQPHTLFMLHCSGCHGADGSGSEIGGIPPFPGIVGAHLKHPEGRRYLANVPGVVNSGLPPADTARLLNYVVETWGQPQTPKDAAPFTAEEIVRLRSGRIDEIYALRRKIAADLRRKGVDIGRY